MQPAWLELGRTRPLVYVTLGSSGTLTALPAVLEALGQLPVDVLLATAGRGAVTRLPDNVVAADFVPGEQIVERAALVVTTGGSTSGYQALAAGVPVVGLPFNLDQYLSMTAIEDQGAGVLVRAGNATASGVGSAVRDVLLQDRYRAAASRLKEAFAGYDCHALFEDWIERVRGGAATAARVK